MIASFNTSVRQLAADLLFLPNILENSISRQRKCKTTVLPTTTQFKIHVWPQKPLWGWFKLCSFWPFPKECASHKDPLKAYSN